MTSKTLGMGMGISFGLCFATAFGVALPNVAVGIVFGVAIGVAFGLAFTADSDAAVTRKHVTSETPLPHPLGLFERDHQPN